MEFVEHINIYLDDGTKVHTIEFGSTTPFNRSWPLCIKEEHSNIEVLGSEFLIQKSECREKARTFRLKKG